MSTVARTTYYAHMQPGYISMRWEVTPVDFGEYTITARMMYR